MVEEIVLPWTVEEISRTMFTHFGYLLGPAMEDDTAGSEPQLAAYTRRFMADARAAAEGNRFVDGLRAEPSCRPAGRGHDRVQRCCVRRRLFQLWKPTPTISMESTPMANISAIIGKRI